MSAAIDVYFCAAPNYLRGLMRMTPSMNVVFAFLTFVALLIIVSVVYDLAQILVASWSGVGARWRFAYVRFSEEMQAKPLALRSVIIAAGPIASFLLATLLFAFTWSQAGFVHVPPAIVAGLVPGGPAAQAGFQVGDRIVGIDGRRIESFTDLQDIVASSAGTELTFEVERGGAVSRLRATPDRREMIDLSCNRRQVGVIGLKRSTAQPDGEYKRLPPVEYVGMTLKDTYLSVRRQFDLALGACQVLGGPVAIVGVPERKLTPGMGLLVALLDLLAALSLGLGIIKLLLWSVLSRFVR